MKSKTQMFIAELEQSLLHLPYVEVVKVINYYQEAISDRLEDGMSEEEIVTSFGSTSEIVAAIEEEISVGSIIKDKVTNNVKATKMNSWVIIILLIIASPLWLAFATALLAIVIAIYAVLWTIPVVVMSLYLTLLAMAFGSIVEVFTTISSDIVSAVGFLGLALCSGGLAFALFKPLLAAGRLWLKLNVWPFLKLKRLLISKN